LPVKMPIWETNGPILHKSPMKSTPHLVTFNLIQHSNNRFARLSLFSLYELEAKGRCAIGNAMNAYHKNTCIRFVPRTNEVDYVQIRRLDITG
jgi:hypothetical protein